MSIDSETAVSEDLKAVLEHIRLGTPIPDELQKRARERGELHRLSLPETNVAVELIRETRDR